MGKCNTILYIDPQGGSGNLGMYDYELLSRMKHEHIIFVGGASYNYLPFRNLECKFWFDYNRKSNPVTKGLSYVWTLIRIMILIIRTNTKVVHIQWIRFPFFDIIYYSFLKNVMGIRLVYTVHNVLPHDRYKNDVKDYSKMYRLCDALMVHTAKTKEQLTADFDIESSKIHIAPHGPLKYIEDEYKITKEIGILKDKYQLDGKIVYLMIGIQSEYKGTDLLVEAWNGSNLLSSASDVVLVIAGRNTDAFIAEGVHGNKIAITKKLSDIEFSAWIKLSDVLVFPYRRIEQSGVLLTVVTEKKPYCTTDVGELTVPIKLYNVGWIVSNVSVDSLKFQLEYIYDHRDEIEAKKNDEDAWICVSKLYDWNKSAYVTENVYKTLSTDDI